MRAFLATLCLIATLKAAAAFSIEEDRLFDAGPGAPVVQIISTTDTAVFAPVIAAYMRKHPDRSVRYVVAGSRDVQQALTEEGARFDLAISSAMDLQMKLANDGLAQPYDSPETAALPGWARWRNLVFAFAQEPVVTVIARDALNGREPPRSRLELTALIRDNPDVFGDRIGTYDPARSGAGYLFATQDARRSDTYWRLSEVMGRLGTRLYSSTAAMMDDLQSGRLAVAYNVLGSYAGERLAAWPGAVAIEMRDFTHVLLRTALVPKDAPNPALGREFLDFLLSSDGQDSLAAETGLPRLDERALAEQAHLRPIRLDPGLLVYVDPLKRRRFLDEWSAAMVQP